ncbi:porin, partial [Variovorax dokdonensis]
MKAKSILAFTAFALAAAGAAAQKSQVTNPVTSSSVTLFGIVDVALSYGSGSAGNITQLTSGRSTPSRWGVRGFEDLGGGLTAGFWLESQINMDTGTFGTTNVNNQPDGSASALFSRRSTVSLISSWGEVRLGRDFTASFRNRDDVDPFGTSGVGANLVDALNLEGPASTRASNMVGYFLPSGLGGFFGEAQYYMGETVDVSGQPDSHAGDGYAARIGWAGAGFAVAVAGSRTNQVQTATLGDVDAYNLGLSYDFEVVKLSGGYYYGKIEQFVPYKATGWLVGA